MRDDARRLTETARPTEPGDGDDGSRSVECIWSVGQTNGASGDSDMRLNSDVAEEPECGGIDDRVGVDERNEIAPTPSDSDVAAFRESRIAARSNHGDSFGPFKFGDGRFGTTVLDQNNLGVNSLRCKK